MPYSSIQAITLDLDDTLWPVWPTIKKAEAALHDWLKTHAPSTAALLETPETMRGRRETLIAEFPHLAHDYNFLRTEAIRRSLLTGGDDPALARTAYEVFYEARNSVELYDDALPALQYLAAKYPIVAISNGTADIQRVGLVKTTAPVRPSTKTKVTLTPFGNIFQKNSGQTCPGCGICFFVSFTTTPQYNMEQKKGQNGFVPLRQNRLCPGHLYHNTPDFQGWY